MKLKLLLVAAALAVILPLVIAGVVFGRALASPNGNLNVHAAMMGNARGGWGYGMMGGGYTQMHETMVAALADALDLPADQVQTRIIAGETPWEIATSTGLSPEEARLALQSAHDRAIEQAVQSGAITQEQSEWMDGMMDQFWGGNGYGCHGSGIGTPGTNLEQ